MSSNSNNKKLSRSEAEQLIYPKTDYIDEQIDIILMDISDNLKNGEFLNDVIYVHELGLLLKQSFKAENIIFTPNGVSMNEIEKVASLGVQINIDNLTILEQFGT